MNISFKQINEIRNEFLTKNRIDIRWELTKTDIEDYIIKRAMLYPKCSNVILSQQEFTFLSDKEYSLRVMKELKKQGFNCHKSSNNNIVVEI